MSSFHSATTGKHAHHRIAVSSTDGWLGNVVARNFLLEAGKIVTIRCMAQDTKTRPIKQLEHLGGEIYKIDYDRTETIEDALHGCGYLVFLIEHDKDRVKEAKILAEAAKRKDVDNVIVISLEGSDEERSKTHSDFNEVERIFCETAKNPVVLRSAFIQQGGEINMTQRETDEFAPIHLDDLNTAICALMLQEGKLQPGLNKRHHHKSYTITGPETLNGKEISDIINKVVSKGEVEYRSVSRHNLEEYLRKLDERDDDCESDDEILTQRDAVYLIYRGLSLLHDSLADFFKGTQQTLESGKITFREGLNRIENAEFLLNEFVIENNEERRIVQNQLRNNQTDDNIPRQVSRNTLNQYLQRRGLCDEDQRNVRGHLIDGQEKGRRDVRNVRGLLFDSQLNGRNTRYVRRSQLFDSQLNGRGGQLFDIQRNSRDVEHQVKFERTVLEFVNDLKGVIERLKRIDLEKLEVLDNTNKAIMIGIIKEGIESIEVLERNLDVIPFLINTANNRRRYPKPFFPLKGKARATDDYNRITGKRASKIKTFFEDNANCFTPHRRQRDIDDQIRNNDTDLIVRGRSRASRL
ncbi:11575_t:CDS:2 [Diversispora eburnea]|uniref:11575_t:CDS:1 n=1 Tax=Diversispora eburnea TaxID=1213867 RepID=A0A9N9GA32_9GLOM|nr:11575_t:CDS:2 [Diversispora eburnea]